MRRHGWYENSVFGCFLYSRLHGAWNAECAIGYATDIRESVLEIRDPWVHVVDGRGWALAIPEVGEHLRDLALWRFRHGMQALAYYGDGNEMNIAFARNNVTADMKVGFFTTSEDLSQWLIELRFTLPEAVAALLRA